MEFVSNFLFQSRSRVIDSFTMLARIIHGFKITLKFFNFLDVRTSVFLSFIMQRGKIIYQML